MNRKFWHGDKVIVTYECDYSFNNTVGTIVDLDTRFEHEVYQVKLNKDISTYDVSWLRPYTSEIFELMKVLYE